MPEVFVVDCSVAAKWILPEPGSSIAQSWLERYAAGSVSLIAPDLLLAEFASLLSKRCRRREISAERASQAFDLMQKSAPRLYETRPWIPRALRLSLESGLSLWDSIYLAVAEEFGCSVITADQRLFRGAKPRHPALQMM